MDHFSSFTSFAHFRFGFRLLHHSNSNTSKFAEILTNFREARPRRARCGVVDSMQGRRRRRRRLVWDFIRADDSEASAAPKAASRVFTSDSSLGCVKTDLDCQELLLKAVRDLHYHLDGCPESSESPHFFLQIFMSMLFQCFSVFSYFFHNMSMESCRLAAHDRTFDRAPCI